MNQRTHRDVERLVEVFGKNEKLSAPVKVYGKVVSAVGTLVKVVGLHLRIGDICRMVTPGGTELLGEVIGLEDSYTILMPLGPMTGLSGATMVENTGTQLMIPDWRFLQGRIVDGFCRPLDGLPIDGNPVFSVNAPITSPLQRVPIDTPFVTGVRAIDALLTCGIGQRVGIFAAAGGGKTTLLSMIARFAKVDAVVVALVGERGREVQDFLRHALAPEDLKRTVVVVATSDRPAAERIKAAQVASAIAESLRAEGKQVLLLVDSITRLARALREIGLAAGEPAARRGYPPSVFAALPMLVERAGRDQQGAITAFYTVLAEDSEGNDPICEEVRSLLDGHIILSDTLAASGQYPAIDILASRSRVMSAVITKSHQDAANQVRKWMASYQKSELLIRLGEYRTGNDVDLDTAVSKHSHILNLIHQKSDEFTKFEDTQELLRTLSTSTQ